MPAIRVHAFTTPPKKFGLHVIHDGTLFSEVSNAGRYLYISWYELGIHQTIAKERKIKEIECNEAIGSSVLHVPCLVKPIWSLYKNILIALGIAQYPGNTIG